MKYDVSMIPHVINNFNVYDLEGNVQIGVTSEVTLAALTNVTTTVSGAGIPGSYDVPVVGHYGSINQQIPFRTLLRPVFDFLSPNKKNGFVLRGPIQVEDKETGMTKFVQLRYVVSGKARELNPGTARVGGTMDGNVGIEATYLKYEIDGENVLEIDKINNGYVVNGVDVYEQVRGMC